MFALSYKSKKYLLVALKVFILAITFGYIYVKITQNETIDFSVYLKNAFKENTLFSILIFCLLAATNWFFEIVKWKKMISETQEISFSTSLKQSLTSLTISLTTPNRIGEYGAKSLFFEKGKRKQILLLNFFHNSFQMLVTIVFGIIGLGIVFENYNLNKLNTISENQLLIGLLLLILLIGIGFYFRKKQLLFKGLSLSNVYLKLNQVSFQTKFKVLLFSIIRYFIFSFLFFKLLQFFGVEISINQALPLVFSMYLLSSIVPTIFIFDVVVKGGVAVWLFSMVGVSDVAVLSAVFSMWLLNFVIPSVFGAYFLMAYKPSYL